MNTMTLPAVDPQEAYRMQQRGDIAVDVREPQETAAGHAAGAVLVPLGQLPQRHGELPRDRRLLVLCATGNRSSVATEELRRVGYDAVNVEGGMAAWQAANLPMTR